jgi:predicted NBD/HSP70 family sugar kinase
MYTSVTGSNSSDLKSNNISAILLALLYNSNISRVYLAQLLGVSNATITNLVSELVEQGYIEEAGLVRIDGQVGRPQRALTLVENARFVLTVHIDVGTVYIGLANILGKLVDTTSFEHSVDSAWQSVLNQVLDNIQELLERNPINQQHIIGIGVAASGLVDVEHGVNVFAPNLKWHDVPIRAYLEERLHYPVFVDNNVRAMAFGEAMFGIARDVNSLVFIYGRVGVGAGLVVNGQLYRGAGAGAGEIGHTMLLMTNDDTDSPTMLTLEKLVSESAILRSAKQFIESHPDCELAQRTQATPLTLNLIFETAREGDAATQTLLDKHAFYLGVALANVVNIYNPELIVVGGIFSRGHDVLLPKVQAVMRQYAFANLGENVTICQTQFGQQAGMIGSAALALDRFFYRPQQAI